MDKPLKEIEELISAAREIANIEAAPPLLTSIAKLRKAVENYDTMRGLQRLPKQGEFWRYKLTREIGRVEKIYATNSLQVKMYTINGPLNCRCEDLEFVAEARKENEWKKGDIVDMHGAKAEIVGTMFAHLVISFLDQRYPYVRVESSHLTLITPVEIREV